MKQKIRIWLRNFFGFSRTETNGFIILVILMAAILSIPFLSKKIYSFYEQPLQSQNEKIHLNSLLSELEKSIVIEKKIKEEKRFQTFDLNKSNSKHLINSGFPEYLAERIVKYREKVKPFESKEELLLIYGIDSVFFQKIYPYIKVSKLPKKPDTKLTAKWSEPEGNKEKKNTQKEINKVKLINFDINKVDSLQLQKVYGIGPAYSKRIIKYREYLGGFHSLQQLKEVYGLKKENIDSLEKYVFVGKNLNLRQLKVNHLNADSLVQHPYISYKEADLIVNYRKQHGEFKSVSDLLAIKVLDSNWVKQVNPYISFD
ncbi:helix-hairpin-helix domain-containing protein [Marivirga sp.]|uniref:ComEA family DNA-binding protein n=1 Tax=Marivirga sp. TaxID=2018662 RepID=UPI0025E5206D|nr:helix-hairpin-helix domain-containing protein [Marivirga sp.]